MTGSSPPLGTLIKHWRQRRRLSQLALATSVGVSARHLSFVETGRSRPSPEMILTLAIGLDVPLRERNTMLLAAGYAPRYPKRALDDPEAAPVRDAIRGMLDAHDPYPGVVIDRQWNVVGSNRAAILLKAGVPDHVLEPRVNVYRVCLHPDGLAARTVNLDEWASYLVGQLRRTLALTADPALAELLEEIETYPAVAALEHRASLHSNPPLLVPLHLRTDGVDMKLFTTLTTFGTPQDVTLDEIAIELFYPADPETARLLQASR